MKRTDELKNERTVRDNRAGAWLIEMGAEFRREHCAIRVNGLLVPLPGVRYDALAVLVDALYERASGVAYLADSSNKHAKNLAAQTVLRLRSDIDSVCGERAGKRLVVSCGGGAYRLTISKEQIVIDENLIELSPLYIPTELAKRMIENSAAIQKRFAREQEVTRTFASYRDPGAAP